MNVGLGYRYGERYMGMVTYSGEADDEGSKVVLDIETFHHTSVDLFYGCRTTGMSSVR
jgi:hypothetical protein